MDAQGGNMSEGQKTAVRVIGLLFALAIVGLLIYLVVSMSSKDAPAPVPGAPAPDASAPGNGTPAPGAPAPPPQYAAPLCHLSKTACADSVPMTLLQNKNNPMFAVKAGHNAGWDWAQGHLCCSKDQHVGAADKVGMCAARPEGSSILGLIGLKEQPASGVSKFNKLTGLTTGGAYNSAWQWYHPSACNNADKCLLTPNGQTCPAGFKNIGTTGIRVPKADIDKVPAGIHRGGVTAEDPNEQWIHPDMCCPV